MVELLGAQRLRLVRLRDEGSIGDEVMHRIERDLDLEGVAPGNVTLSRHISSLSARARSGAYQFQHALASPPLVSFRVHKSWLKC